MNEITKSFYDVMYKYEKRFSQKGVAENLKIWDKNKGVLVNLLRRHPNWNEKELAIVFNFSEGRAIDRDIVDECKFALTELVEVSELTKEQKSDFYMDLSAITYDYAKCPADEHIEMINKRGNIKCASGQKASRMIGKLCNHYGINHHGSYNSVFARLADAFSPIEVDKTGVLSVHPCDFLEMSNKDNSWSSCHRLDHGDYQAGCLSYLSDAVSMIFFTVDNDVKENFHKSPKRTRQVFCYAENLLLQSRLYPNDSNEQFDQYRSLVQKAITTCMGLPNFWTLKSNKADTSPYYLTVEGSSQYPDYAYYAKVSLLKGAETHGNLAIGHPPICVCCGDSRTSRGNIKCSCENLVVCADCGETVPANNARYIEGVYSCNACLHICATCHNTVRTDMYPAFNREGHLVEVCPGCYEQMTSVCGSCSVQAVCSILSGARFCQRASATAVA